MRVLLAEDSKAAAAHTVLAHFAQKEGDLEAARAHYETALKLDAHDAEARRQYALLKK